MSDSTIITSPKDFSGKMTLDLTDDEIKRGFELVVRIKTKWESIFRQKFGTTGGFSLEEVLESLSEFEDEVKTTLAEQLNVLATVDTVPILEGQPPVIEWIGKLPDDDIYKYGLDHEKKSYEVNKAKDRGEDYLGQKGK